LRLDAATTTMRPTFNMYNNDYLTLWLRRPPLGMKVHEKKKIRLVPNTDET